MEIWAAITVTGYKKETKPEQQEIIVTGHKLQKSSQQPVTVIGNQSETKPEQEQIVNGKKIEKKLD